MDARGDHSLHPVSRRRTSFAPAVLLCDIAGAARDDFCWRGGIARSKLRALTGVSHGNHAILNDCPSSMPPRREFSTTSMLDCLAPVGVAAHPWDCLGAGGAEGRYRGAKASAAPPAEVCGTMSP